MSTLAAPACGQWLVAIDLDTCRASAPMPLFSGVNVNRYGVCH